MACRRVFADYSCKRCVIRTQMSSIRVRSRSPKDAQTQASVVRWNAMYFAESFLRFCLIPPTSLAAAAALIALALEWRDDPLVDDILKEARGHTEKSIRIVALSDALGVLQTTFSTPPAALPGQIRPLDDDERDWLVGRLRGARYTGQPHRIARRCHLRSIARSTRFC